MVTRVPTTDELDVVTQKVPGVLVYVEVQPGDRLSELVDQDNYSFKLAHMSRGWRRFR